MMSFNATLRPLDQRSIAIPAALVQAPIFDAGNQELSF
jgi:hypothetical protein